MNGPDLKALELKLNPTVFTARASLMGGAANGDRNAEKLLDLIEKDEQLDEKNSDADEDLRKELFRFSSVYGTAVWVRNKIADRVFESHRMTSFIDLGCGINPRGIYMASRGYVWYLGIDLPDVTERMKRIMFPITGAGRVRDRITYAPADITDRSAVRSLIRRREPLFIVTEGVMMYLTESEMRTVVGNIAELLSEFGGVWFTGDHDEQALYGRIMNNMFGGSGSGASRLVSSELSEKWRKLMYANSFIKLDDDGLSEFLSGYGLNCRRFEVAPYLRGICAPEKILKAFELTEFRMMTYEAADIRYRSPEGKTAFGLDTGDNGNGITIGIHGRLDSLTAPKLVTEYERRCGNDKLLPVVIDMADCPYISSAGIRAILMLFKRTSGIKDGFSLRNIRPDVLEILNTTGFTELMKDI